MKKVASLLGQMVFDRTLMRFDQGEAAIEVIERQAAPLGKSNSSGKAVPGSQ